MKVKSFNPNTFFVQFPNGLAFERSSLEGEIHQYGDEQVLRFRHHSNVDDWLIADIFPGNCIKLASPYGW